MTDSKRILDMMSKGIEGDALLMAFFALIDDHLTDPVRTWRRREADRLVGADDPDPAHGVKWVRLERFLADLEADIERERARGKVPYSALSDLERGPDDDH